MPSTSGKQARFMAMCAHSPQHAYGKCPSHAVASEFNEADKGTSILKTAGRRRSAKKTAKVPGY